jgi:hypothetical protein
MDQALRNLVGLGLDLASVLAHVDRGGRLPGPGRPRPPGAGAWADLVVLDAGHAAAVFVEGEEIDVVVDA